MGRLAKVTSKDVDLADTVHVFGPKCWYVELLPYLNEEDKKELDEQLNSSVTGTLVSKRIRAAFPDELRAIQRNVKGYSVARHRRGECSCGTLK